MIERAWSCCPWLRRGEHSEYMQNQRQNPERFDPTLAICCRILVFGPITVEKTIKVHRARVMEKMQTKSLAELVQLAARVGITSASET